jgi:hypothetical protein
MCRKLCPASGNGFQHAFIHNHMCDEPHITTSSIPPWVQALQPCFVHLQVLQLGYAEASVAAALAPQLQKLFRIEMYHTVLSTEAVATALGAVSSLLIMKLAGASTAAQVCEIGWCALMACAR